MTKHKLIIYTFAVIVAAVALFCRQTNHDEPAVENNGPAPGNVAPHAAENSLLNVFWGRDYESMEFEFRGQEYKLPQLLGEENFPAPGRKPVYDIYRKWPDYTMHARWSASTKGWPVKYRPNALSFVLMRACDAELMEKVFPKAIRKSSFTYPPLFVAEASRPEDKKLISKLRGSLVSYEVKATAGIGAADYKVNTRIRVGVSADKKNLFYYDNPAFITDYLDDREIIFAARDTGDKILFDIYVVCLCKPRRLFRDTMLNRIEASNRYFIDRLYYFLSDAPTQKEIDDYYALLRHVNRTIEHNSNSAE